MSYLQAIDKAIAAGSFGKETLQQVKLGDNKHEDFQASSNFFFVKVITDKTEKCLVVKTQPYHRRESEISFRDRQFSNEVCFYSKLLPFLSSLDNSINDIFPEYMYGCANGDSSDTVIMEDLTPKGYRSNMIGRELDMDHIILTLQTIAKFHAISYKAKKENPGLFKKLLTGLQNDMAIMEAFIAAGLCSAPSCYKGTQNELQRLNEFCCNDPLNAYRTSIIPEEPNAVLCHGDFCSNNMLFLYNGTKPEQLKLVDMQRVRYSSPAIDLSFFLLFNTSENMKKHWDFFLHTYYESLSTAYPEVPVPSFNDFLKDFIEHVVYGVATCSYFFRIITLPKDEIVNFLLLENYDKEKYIGKTGGDEAFKLINGMLQLLIRKNYV